MVDESGDWEQPEPLTREEKNLAARYHQAFLKTVNGNPKNMNVSQMAKRLGVDNTKLWRYANGKCGWELELWLRTMLALKGGTDNIVEYIKSLRAESQGSEAA